MQQKVTFFRPFEPCLSFQLQNLSNVRPDLYLDKNSFGINLIRINQKKYFSIIHNRLSCLKMEYKVPISFKRTKRNGKIY